MPTVYEILVRGDYSGKITGAHQILWETPKSVGAALPLDPAAVGKLLGEAFPGLANDLISANKRIATLESELATLQTAAKARIAELEHEIETLRAAGPVTPPSPPRRASPPIRRARRCG